ncbi:RHS repeat-associated core domain-containing protein [Aeromicrobium sp. YIM 150415]|uniref:RHS repeat-associated core domain-containing protein n=1 Tax=Aeromicrobium sp. YIM 150415 TaxID=2803912 RepID=UPI00196465C7|nr:RHS repeat-associated core domain-containing protein [Aeromicrobium sp. YIM 150415]MBM9462208.1 RHS repeat-associated core domain-containing protein [Aeromicrobium sp. YIM 150415]
MRARLLGVVVGSTVAIGGMLVFVPAVAEPGGGERPGSVWEAPAEVNREPVGEIPEGDWSADLAAEEIADDEAELRTLMSAGDDEVAAPGLGVQEHYGFEEFGLDDIHTAAVNLGNGNLVVRAEDLAINGPGIGLSLDRFYNGLSQRFGGYGPKWSISAAHDIGLEVGPTMVVFRAPSGFRAHFTEADGGWQTPPGLQADLAQQGNGEWVVTYRQNGERLVFTAGGFLLRNEDRNGNALTYAYGANNRVASVTDAAGRVTSYEYTGVRVSTITDPAGRVFEFGYDDDQRLTSVKGADGATRHYGYDDAGRLTRITTAEGSVTSFGYDDRNRVSSVDRHLTSGEPDSTAATTSFSYAAGQTTLTDPDGNDSTIELDDDGRVTSVTDPLGRTRSQEWTPNSQVATQTDAMGGGTGEGNVTSYSYDDANNPTQVQLPTGAAANATYGIDDGCASPTSGHPHLVKCSTDPEGGQKTFAYDGPGNLTHQTDTTNDSGGQELSYTHHGIDGASCGGKQGQQCSSTNGNGHTTQYTYDGDGNLATVTPPGPVAPTTYSYDSVGRVTQTEQGDQVIGYVYDAADRLVQQTEEVAGEGAWESDTVYDFDDDGQLTAEVRSGEPISGGAYGAQSRRDHSYDTRGNTTAVQTRVPADGSEFDVTIAMGYDSRSNMTSHDDGVTGARTYAYDAASQLTQLTDPGGSVTFTYDDNGNETGRSLPGGASISKEYDDSSRPTRISSVDGDGEAVSDYSYSFDDDGVDRSKIQARTDHVGIHAPTGSTISYAYDSLGRLVDANESSGGSHWTYEYDLNGNRTKSGNATTTYNEADQVVDPGGNSSVVRQYDDKGNMEGSTNTVRMIYNSANQLSATRVFGTGGAVPTEAAYIDSSNTSLVKDWTRYTDLGRTIEKTRFEAESFGGLALRLTELNSASEKLHESITRLPDGRAVSISRDSGTEYLVGDHQDSTTAKLNAEGSAAAVYAYEPYGSRRATPAPDTLSGFVGTQAGLGGTLKLGARYYQPGYGTFTQMDPAGEEQNPYLYAAGDPVNNLDPTGLANVSWQCGLSWAGSAIGAGSLLFTPFTGGTTLAASTFLIGLPLTYDACS